MVLTPIRNLGSFDRDILGLFPCFWVNSISCTSCNVLSLLYRPMTSDVSTRLEVGRVCFWIIVYWGKITIHGCICLTGLSMINAVDDFYIAC